MPAPTRGILSIEVAAIDALTPVAARDRFKRTGKRKELNGIIMSYKAK